MLSAYAACGRSRESPRATALSSGGPAAASSPVVLPVACGATSADAVTNQDLIEAEQDRRSPPWFRSLFPTVQIVVDSRRLWPSGPVRVRFIDSTSDRQQHVQAIASEWISPDLNLSFQYVDSEPADVRVSLPDQVGAAQSEIGILARNIPVSRPTMIIGFDRTTSEEQLRALVLHEFGHALGAVHEHQRLDAGIKWDKEYVYGFYRKQYGWDEPQVDRSVFSPHAGRVKQSAVFDRNSVMMYAILPGFTTDGFVQRWNARLSAADIQLMNELYGKP